MRIFIDFEATEAGEIISVGAITETGEKFYALSRPLYSPLTERITALTGITQEDLDGAAPFWLTCRSLIAWANSLDTGNGYHFFSFGKNDRVFVNTTARLYRSNGSDDRYTLEPMEYLANKLTNGADPIYKAFNRPLVSLRSAYLTYKNSQGELENTHNALEDAQMMMELILAVEDGWKLPEDAEIVKVQKPVLPAKAPAEDFCTPSELHRTVVCYWTKGNSDKVAVYRDLVTAAKALCTKALNAGVTPEKAAYRVLQAAMNGESYCDRRFFLVD